MPFIDHEPIQEDIRCKHPEHNPPAFISLKPGTHKWICPSCGAVQFVTIKSPTLTNKTQLTLRVASFGE